MESLTSLLPNNDNVTKTIKNNVNDIDSKADYLVAKLNNPVSRPFYCLVSMKLTEAQVAHNLEIALRGKNPQRYFTWLCRRTMA